MKNKMMKTGKFIARGIFTALFISVIFAFSPSKEKGGENKNNTNKTTSTIVHLSDFNFKNEISKGVVLVDFWAPWCAPCKRIAPILEDIATEMKSFVKVCKLNVDEHQKYAQQYSIQGIPTMILFKNGKEVKRIVGLQTKENIVSEIKNVK